MPILIASAQSCASGRWAEADMPCHFPFASDFVATVGTAFSRHYGDTFPIPFSKFSPSTPRRFLCIGSPQQKRGGCCISCARNAKDARRYRQAMNRCGRVWLDDPDFDATFASSRSRQGAFARHCDGRTGCGVPRVAVCKQPREAPETRPPPLRADARSSQTVKRTLLHPARGRANNRRGGAPRGERSRCERKARAMRLRAYVTGPPTGAAAPERLSALRSPHSCRGGMQTSEG